MKPPRQRRFLSQIALLALLAPGPGCGTGPTPPSLEDQARALVGRFQKALLVGDETSLHHCLRRNARPLLPTLLGQDLSERQEIEILGARRSGAEVLVDIRDPNPGQQASYFVCCIEGGELRIDLLATARRQQQVERIQLAEPVFQPSRMTPEQKALAARYRRSGTK